VSTINEKVSTVGVRNQVTLPKTVRERVDIANKATAFILAADKEDFLIITFQSPSSGVYNKIKISEKGQLVIPKNLRMSMGIAEGTNLVFSVTEKKMITIRILEKSKESTSANSKWQFLTKLLEIAEQFRGLEKTSVENSNALLLHFIKPTKVDKSFANTLAKLEDLLGSRLVPEILEGGKKIKLVPLLVEN
jgi:AbrB family looped-hinge helix DNA binding protein